MISSLRIIIVSLLIFCALPGVEAKKIKNSFVIKKEKVSKKRSEPEKEGREICLQDSLNESASENDPLIRDLQKVGFAGYDKEPNSSVESFMMLNNSGQKISGFKIRIDYLDMQDRLFHSRIVEESCEVPPGEPRRMDIVSWDKQHTYYYYLGNAPKRVATPFKVAIHPLSFWIEE